MADIYKQLKEKIEKMKTWIPLTVREILEMKVPKRLFLVEGFIPKQGITIISGHPGKGKSWILMHIAYCVSKGKPVFDKFIVERSNVLVIDEETGLYELNRRMNLMKFRKDTDIYFFSDAGIKVDNHEINKKLIEIVREKDIKLVIFDPFASIHSKQENVSDEIQKVIEALRKIAVDGTAVLIAHHNRKDNNLSIAKSSSQNMRGSSAIWAGINSHLDIIVKSENDTEAVIHICHNKLKNGKKLKPFKIKMVDENGIIYFDYLGESFETLSMREKVRDHILNRLDQREELDVESLQDKNIAGESSFRSALSDLKSEGLITSRKVGSGKELFLKAEKPVS